MGFFILCFHVIYCTFNILCFNWLVHILFIQSVIWCLLFFCITTWMVWIMVCQWRKTLSWPLVIFSELNIRVFSGQISSFSACQYFWCFATYLWDLTWMPSFQHFSKAQRILTLDIPLTISVEVQENGKCGWWRYMMSSISYQKTIFCGY